MREFCSLSMPVIMLDKDENYVVLKLEEVSLPSFCFLLRPSLQHRGRFALG
jgi:hypothetical protein